MNTPDEQVLLSGDRDGIRTLTLNRPHRKNAIDARLWRDLAVPTVAKVTGVAVGAGWNLGAEQGAAQRRRQRHFRRGGGQRGPRTAGELRHGRLRGGVRGVRGKAEPEFTGQWAVPPPRGQERSDSGDGTRGQERSDPGNGTRSEQDNA